MDVRRSLPLLHAGVTLSIYELGGNYAEGNISGGISTGCSHWYDAGFPSYRSSCLSEWVSNPPSLT